MPQAPEYYDDGSLSSALCDLVEGMAHPPAAEVAFCRRLAGVVLEIGSGPGRIA